MYPVDWTRCDTKILDVGEDTNNLSMWVDRWMALRLSILTDVKFVADK